MFSFHISVTGLRCCLPALSRPFCCFCLNSLSEPFGTGRLVSVPSTAHFVKQKQQKIRFLFLSDSVAQSTVSNWMETNICEAIVSDSAVVPKFAVSPDAARYHYSLRRLCRVRCISEMEALLKFVYGRFSKKTRGSILQGGAPDPATSSGKKNTKAAAGVTYVTFLICPVTVFAKQRVWLNSYQQQYPHWRPNLLEIELFFKDELLTPGSCPDSCRWTRCRFPEFPVGIVKSLLSPSSVRTMFLPSSRKF